MNSKLNQIVLVCMFLISLQFFAFRYFSVLGTLWNIVYAIFYFVVGFKLFADGLGKYDEFLSSKYVLLFVFLPVVTIFSCWLTHGQSIVQTTRITWDHFIVIVYFFLIQKKIEPKLILKLLTICMFVKLGLTIIQQFTLPNTFFAARFEGYDEVRGVYMEQEIRSGIARFLISDAYYLYLIVAFRAFQKMRKKISVKSLVLFVLCCLGIYLDQTRQIMFSFLVTLLAISFFKSKRKLVYLFVVGIIVLISLQFVNILFGELIEQTSNEADDDYIRLLSYTYYLTDYHGLFSFLFGNGYGDHLSSWGKEIDYLEVNLRLYRVDIGIVGAYHLLGAVFVFVMILYCFKVIKKNWSYIDEYLQMMLFSILVTIPMLFVMYNTTFTSTEFFMGCLLYLVDMSIRKNKMMKRPVSKVQKIP